MPEHDRPLPEIPSLDLASIFLGPKGENAEEFERLLLDAVRDHVFWRRNFHPEDGFLVSEMEKRDPAYERSLSTLRQELLGLLSELKGGVPSFSPRYSGHMSSDLTMAGLVGYFATMLYNPNNVAAEVSPVTTRMELEVAGQLAAMIGYSRDRQWGHLTSGGTVANFEALWVARNVKYLAVAVRWSAREATLHLPVELADGTNADLDACDLWSLLNVTPSAALDLLEAFRDAVGDTRVFSDLLARHSLAGLGYQEFGRRLSAEFGDSLPPGVVLVPSTAHYSWEKICRSLGIGGANLRHVPVDHRFRMDPDALTDTVRSLAAEKRAIIACVPVIGTTEESAVDRLDLIADLRDWARHHLGIGFHLHADAAYGGYAAAVTRGRDGSRLAHRDLGGTEPVDWPSEGVFKALVALERADSVTIDPHKLGFVPYPAGAIAFRDGRGRELVAVEAPYLFHRGASEWGFIGRYIFEGSKPGAAAAAVWMSHKVLPLDANGYGRLIRDTARGAHALHQAIATADWRPFRIRLLPPPDLNIVCFVASHPDLRTLEAVNAFVDRIYRAMSVDGTPARALPDYLVTKTILRAGPYGDAPLPIVEALGFSREEYVATGGLNVIRCTVMDPFISDGRGRTDHIAGFVATLGTVLEHSLAPV